MPVVQAQSVSKRFLLRHNASVELKVRFLGLLHPDRRQSIEEFWALRNISLHIEHGEALGLVGRNGSGKSTFLKLIAATHRPTSGRLLVARGARISSMIELGVGFHPELTGRENVFLNAAIHGLTRAEIDGIYDAVVAYSGLEHFIDVPIKNYSSGMHMRLGFAISANLDPDILLLDEIFAVGDADFQQRCVGTLKRFMDEGKTIIFVSHEPSSIRAICRRVCVLEQGELAFDGDVEGGLAFYERSLERRTAPADGSAGAVAQPAVSAGDEGSARRQSDIGPWQLEFLRRQGLQPRHHVLEIGRDSVTAAAHLRPFLEENHYRCVERSSGTFELDEPAAAFDVALANSVFAHVPFNDVARCIATVVRTLRPDGRFYATWFENPDPANFDPIVHPSGVTTYSDREPYHYPFGLIAVVCEAVGATVERVTDPTHPWSESVLVIARAL